MANFVRSPGPSWRPQSSANHQFLACFLGKLLYLLCASLSLSRTQTKSGNDKRPSQPSQTTDQSEPVSLVNLGYLEARRWEWCSRTRSTRTKSLRSPKAGQPCLILMCILHLSSRWIQSVKKCIWRERHWSVLRLYGMDLGFSVPGRSHSWQS